MRRGDVADRRFVAEALRLKQLVAQRAVANAASELNRAEGAASSADTLRLAAEGAWNRALGAGSFQLATGWAHALKREDAIWRARAQEAAAARDAVQQCKTAWLRADLHSEIGDDLLHDARRTSVRRRDAKSLQAIADRILQRWFAP